MAFCEFSNKYKINSSVSIENKFIMEFMPNAPENAVKVYMYGLYKCANPGDEENCVEHFAQKLSLSTDEIIDYFYYWEELGLVSIKNTNPFEIRYLPCECGSTHLKKVSSSKYKNFNIKAQELITGRMITPNEYNEYYWTIESLHIEIDAFLLIISYCVNTKGNNVNYPYILSVAKNWAYEGLLTYADIEERIQEQEKNSSDITLVLKNLKIKRNATTDEYQLYLGWKNDYKIELNIILYLAKLTAKGLGGFNKLNYFVNKVYTLKLNSLKEVEEYFENEKVLFELAKNTNKKLGIRNTILENVVDNYFTFWQRMGFDNDSIMFICEEASKRNLRSYDDVQVLVDNYYRAGLLTLNELKGAMAEYEKNDKKISELLETLGIIRKVSDVDRSFYTTWSNEWRLSHEIIAYAIHQAKGTRMPMREANRILSTYFQHNVNTLDEAKKIKVDYSTPVTNSKKPTSRKYTPQEIEQGYDNIFEVEV